MSGWGLLGMFALMGFIGGLAKALIGGNGVVLPKTEGGVWVPGFIGTLVAGPLAAALSWALYGPLAKALAIGSDKGAETIKYTASFSELAGGVLVGFAGAQWITAESDKRLAKATAAEVATKAANPELATALANATPVEALALAQAAP